MDLLERFHSHEDFHQSVEFAAVMESIGWSSIPVSGSRIAVRQLGPVSLAKMQRAKVVNFQRIHTIRRKLRIFRTVIEPTCVGTCIDDVGKKHTFSFIDTKSSRRAMDLFARHGYTPIKEHYSHSKTAILDLSQSIESLTANFPSKTRYNIKIANRLVNSYRTIRFDALTQKEKKSFYILHALWSSEKKIEGFSNDFLDKVITNFQAHGWMILSTTNNEFSGGMMVIIHDRTAYYFYTCTSMDGKTYHVPTGLAYQAFCLAKKQGADIFDFCSVFDERYPQEHPRWKGFTQFKSRFAPVDIYYPPSFSRWV